MAYTVVGESRAQAEERERLFLDELVVVPELQRRGLFRHRYTGATLRDHLGLARPAIAARG